jgi:hypothetical protein
MKVKLKSFKYNGMLKKEFPSIEDAQRYAQLMANRFPGMIFEPYIEEGGDDGKSKSPKSRAEKFSDSVRESRENFEDQLWELFENE